MKKALLVVLVLVISLTTIQPVYAASYDLRVHNNTEDPVKIKLKGPETYSFTVQPGKIIKTVEEGTYEYSYTACGVDVDGEITVNKDRVWLIIDKCSAPVTYAKFVVDSHFGETLSLTLTGPQEYDLTVNLGTNKFIDIITGDYVFSYDACDTTISGVITVTKNGRARLTLRSCERREIREFGLPNPSNLRIGNHYSFPLDVTLIGPKQYFVQVQPGYNRLDVIRGTYTYIYTAFGKVVSGEFSVTGGGIGVIFSPRTAP